MRNLSIVFLGLVVGCGKPPPSDDGGKSPSSDGAMIGPADVVTSMVTVDGESWFTGALYAGWGTIVAPDEQSCEPSLWLGLREDPYYVTYTPGAQPAEAKLVVQLPVPTTFQDGNSTPMPAAQLNQQLPLLLWDSTGNSVLLALSGGLATWADDGAGTLTLTIDGADRCDVTVSDCSEETDNATLEMQGAIPESGSCIAGVAGSVTAPSGAPLCVLPGGRADGPWNCDDGPPIVEDTPGTSSP